MSARVCAALICGAAIVAPADAQAPRARQGLLSLDDARLFYEIVGTGEPIVVVHGGPGLDHAYLQPGLDVLAASHTLIYYDQRGTGRSSAPLDPAAINFDAFVEDIDALRETLGYQRISLLAHSFGALLGLEYASRYPERLRGLVLMNPVEPGSLFREEIQERQARARTEEDSTDLATLTAAEGYEARDPATLSAVYRVAFRQTMRNRDRVEELDLDLAAATARNGQDVARLLGASMGTVEWWGRLGDIDVPTLVIHGRYDVPPVELSRALADSMAAGSLVVLESGHFPYVEDQGGLVSAVAGFLAGLRR